MQCDNKENKKKRLISSRKREFGFSDKKLIKEFSLTSIR